MRPLTKPSTNAPRTPKPPACASRFCKLDGKAKSKNPNMLSAITRNRAASTPTTHELAKALPNALPVNADSTPSGVKSTAMPRTKEVDSSAAFARLSACRAPNTLTVIAIIG